MKKKALILMVMTTNLFSFPSKTKKDLNCCECLPAYNAFARIETQASWDIVASASFIYWTPKQVGLDLGILSSKDLNIHSDKVLVNKTNFFPGFTVLLGTNFNNDHWNADIKYTSFHSREKQTQGTPSWSNGIINSFDDLYSVVKDNWKQELDFFDLIVGRAYYNGKKLTIKPNVSARGGWTKQSFKIHGLAENLEYLKLKNRSWFLGPQISADYNWLLTYNFRIFFNTSASLLYQKFDTDYLFIIHSLPRVLLRNLQAKTKQVTPNVDIKCGLGWSSFFDHYNWHIDLLITYDFLYFWNQNEFTAIKDFRDYYNYHASGDLMLHGIELSLKINF